MCDKHKLTVELVPQSCWYTNVRSNVTQEEWDVIRKKSYRLANYRCEICGDVGTNQGVKHAVECHEIFEYDDENNIQTLVGLVSLCPYCHKVKHPGLANIRGEYPIVLKQLMKVNGMNEDEADGYLRDAFDQWERRSEHEWELNIDYVKTFLNWNPF